MSNITRILSGNVFYTGFLLRGMSGLLSGIPESGTKYLEKGGRCFGYWNC